MRRPRQKLWFVLLSTAVTLVAPPHSLRAQDRPLRDVIDTEISAAWARENVSPAKPGTDAEFLRRVYLDLVGTIPTYAETVAFLDSKEADKRAKLVDRLLADSRYAQHQSDVWDL